MIYSVIVDVSASEVDRIFHYKGENYSVGSRVLVNFANRIVEGFIVGQQETTDYPSEKIKEIIRPLDDFTAVSQNLLQLGEYMRKQYNLRWVDVLRLFIPAQMRGGRVKSLSKKFAQLSVPSSEVLPQLKQNAVKQRQLAEYLQKEGTTACEKLNAMFGNAALNALCKKGFVSVFEMSVNRTPYRNLPLQTAAAKILTDAQQKVVDTLLQDGSGKYLLHGVTGSGKTEVYLTVIDAIVRQGKTAIMLVPEISLTPNMLRQLRERFGNAVALLHSGLSAGERYDEWLRLKKGDAQIAIGARSAVFAPLDNIGAIIVDEEHDASYVSDFNPRYDAIQVASFRAQQEKALLILGSATPSLSAFYDAQRGKLKLLSLPERINKKPLPKVEIVNMSKEVAAGHRGIFSRLLLQELKETLDKGNQAMIFLNRRGYSSFLMCTKCGYVAKCSDCDVSLTVHREENLLKCHYCGKKYYMLTKCPNCHEESFRQGRIGTQQIVSLLQQAFPGVKILRMDADTTQTKESHGKILEAFAREEAQILVGTQMIAKGHDFPKVTLVGILDGDQSLHHDDYMASERTFQLLTQVAGRSGRSVDDGKVVLQTYTPNHYCVTFAARQDYLGFYKREISIREAAGFPPFTEIVRVLFQGEDEKHCIDELTAQFAKLCNLRQQKPQAFLYLDKMRCPLKRAEKKYRFQILMKLDEKYAEEIISEVFDVVNAKQRSDVSVFAERNPQNLS